MIGPWLKLCISALCLAALFWWADPANIARYLGNVDLIWVAAAFAALTASTLSMAHRWQITAGTFGVPLSYAFALREYYLAQLINTVLPGGVTGDVTRAVRVRARADLASAAQSVMAERLLGQIALCTALVMGFSFVSIGDTRIPWGQWSWIILMALVLGGAAFYWVMRRPNAAGRFLHKTIMLFKRPAIALHGVITTAGLMLAFYACARAVGIAIPPSGWFTLIPLVLCAMLVPLSIGGWGWREGAAAALFPLIAAPPSAGIAAGVTYGIVVFLAALPAVFIMLFDSLSNLFPSDKEPHRP